MTTTIKNIPAGTTYLSDVMTELPVNCLFNKGITGCGGTTIALNNSIPTVICVPYISLADNKADQSKTNKGLYPYEVFPVHGKVTDEKFSEYLENALVPKIIVTYDSLRRVMNKITPSDYYLLIDEYHCLFTQYSFRKKSALVVLNNYSGFKNFTFMTATPTDIEFTLDELKDVDVVNAVWEESLTVKVNIVKSTHGVEKTIKHHINEILDGKFVGNYYFFVNSVRFMKKMIQNCSLNAMNCRVIYSENNETKLSIPRGTATDQPRKINFITSCAFEGSDFYDENGKIVIISDGNNPNTLIDISTQFLQISGRIRNSKYNQAIYHVVSRTRYSEKLPYKKFKNLMDGDIKKEQSEVADLQNMKNPAHRIDAAAGFSFRFFHVDKELQTITPDLNASKIDLYNYRILNSDYSTFTHLDKQYEKNGVEVQNWIQNNANPELIPMDDVINFKDTMLELESRNEKKDLIGAHLFIVYKAAAVNTFDFLEKALIMLGFEGIRELKYKVSDIKRKIVQLSPRTSETVDESRISQLLIIDNIFTNGSTHTCSYAKEYMNKCYKELGIKKTATSKDFETYFHVKNITKSIDGQQQRALAILSHKITF